LTRRRTPPPTRRRAHARLTRTLAATLVVAAACGALATVASAATFDDYHARVRSAYKLISQLWTATDPEEGTPDGEHLEWERQMIARLHALLPPRERVERAGGAVEVDNSWFQKELDAYVALPPDKVTEKETKLALIGERLRVLEAHLAAEAGANASAAARDKEAEKGRLQTILRRAEYNEQASKGGALDGFWKWLRELWEKLMPKRSPVGRGTASLFSVIARVFVYALAVGLIVFLVWRYGPHVWNRLSARRRAGRGREARVVLGERLAPDQSASDLISEAEALARAGDLRAAIRKAYIAVLCDLGDRHVIRLAQHKTNRDYLTSVRPLAELYATLRPLTHSFERHWYGLAPATDADWAEYRTLCKQALGA
jgi:hypothetical protein